MTLTNDQYDAFYLAASNLIFHSKNKDKAIDFADQMMAYTAFVTGRYSDKSVIEEAMAKAQKLPDDRTGADAIIRLFIGDFSYDESQAWREAKIPKSEIELLDVYSEQQ